MCCTRDEKLTIGQERQSVGCVTGNAALDGLDILPVALGGSNLQAGHMLAEQQRQRSEIRMTAFGVRLSLVPVFLAPRIVDHVSKMVVRDLIVCVQFRQVVLGQFQDDADQSQELVHHFFVHILVESADLLPIGFGYLVLGHIGVGRYVFMNVELDTAKRS